MDLVDSVNKSGGALRSRQCPAPQPVNVARQQRFVGFGVIDVGRYFRCATLSDLRGDSRPRLSLHGGFVSCDEDLPALLSRPRCRSRPGTGPSDSRKQDLHFFCLLYPYVLCILLLLKWYFLICFFLFIAGAQRYSGLSCIEFVSCNLANKLPCAMWSVTLL